MYIIEEDESSLVFTVDTQADSDWEKHSKIEMTIKSEAWYDIDSNKSSAGIVVRDDEFVDSVAKLSVSPNPVGEGAGKTVATVTVTTDGDKKPHGEASVTVKTSDGTATADSDYTALDTSVKFTESDFSSVTVDGNTRYQATKTVEVSITQDTVDEENETFSISASTDSGSPISIGGDDSTVSVTITDDDEPPALTALSVSPGTLTPAFSSSQTSYTVPGIGYGTHQLTIDATPESGADVSYLDSSGNALDDLDDAAAGHQVSLGIGDTTVKVRVTKDGLSQDYTLVITRAKPTVSVRALTTGAATEGDKIKFEVERSESAGDALAVKYTLDEVGVSAGVGPGDMLTESQEKTTHSVTIAANETKATAEVPTSSDSTWENHSKIELDIADDDSYTVDDTKDSASILVKDDEFVASVAVLTISPNPVEETAGKVVATVTVTTEEDKKPHGQVSIPVTTSDGTAKAREDYTAVNSSLVFKEEDFDEVEEDGDTLYRDSKTLEIPILDDSLDEDDETFNVEMGPASQSLVEIEPLGAAVSQ